MHHHNLNADHDPGARPQLVAVRFEYAHPQATAVAVAGSFNDWHPTTRTMHPAGGGYWLQDTVLPPGTYEYCLVVDGRWLPDPLARETVPNPFGGRNSVLKVGAQLEAARLADGGHLPAENSSKQKTQKL